MQRQKPWLLYHSLVLRLLNVLLSVSSSLFLGNHRPFWESCESSGSSPQKKCVSASDFMSSQMLRSSSVDALESIGSRLRTLDWEMWVSLLSWKAASVSLLREVPNPSHLSCSLTKWLAPPQPHLAPAAHDEHLPAHLPDTSKSPPLQQSPCYPQVELAIPALGPIVPRILPSWPLKHLMLVS